MNGIDAQRRADLLRLLRDRGPLTRAEVGERTGWGRATVAQRLDGLLSARLVVSVSDASSTGGRPPGRLSFNGRAGVVLAACLGESRSDVAVFDLGGDLLAVDSSRPDLAEGPIATLQWLVERLDVLLARAGRAREEVWGVGLGLPGAVEFATGRPIGSPPLPGWEGFAVGAWLSTLYGRPAFVDNDANMMALGARAALEDDVEHLVFVSADVRVGAGMIVNGELHRGTNGLAGELGHISLPGHGDVRCDCGNRGCVEAVVGGRAVAARLTREGLPAVDARDVAEHVLTGDPRATRAVRDAGRDLGCGLAGLVNALNPAVLVIGGALGGDHLVTGVREILYQQSLPLATSHLRIVPAGDGLQGVTGAASMTTASLLADPPAPVLLRRAG